LTPTRYTPHQQIAVLGDLAAHTALGRKLGQIIFRDLAEPLFLPSIERDHEMAGEAFHQPAGPEIVEAFLLKRRGQRTQARFLVTQRHRADHGGEHQPPPPFLLPPPPPPPPSHPPP